MLPGVILPKVVLGNEMRANLKVFPERSNKKLVGSSSYLLMLLFFESPQHAPTDRPQHARSDVSHPTCSVMLAKLSRGMHRKN
jgi:hypothetical protein